MTARKSARRTSRRKSVAHRAPIAKARIEHGRGSIEVDGRVLRWIATQLRALVEVVERMAD